MYVFGGQDDDNNKLDDLWSFDRSGHSSVVYGSKMYIFGGIFELTKELNDLTAFDFTTGKFKSYESKAEMLERT